MLGKDSKEKSYEFKFHKRNAEDNNILLSANLSKILNFIGLSTLKSKGIFTFDVVKFVK